MPKQCVVTDIESQTASGRGAGQGRGSFLFAAETDRRRVGLDMLIRLAESAFAVALFAVRDTGSSRTSMLWLAAALFAVYTLWQLLHMGDRMELYQNGILCQGMFYPIGRETRIAWVGSRPGLSFLPSTYLDVSGCGQRIDVSFMKDARKLFNRAYGFAAY